MGTGLIGLLSIQLLRAHGCRVLAIDFIESRLKMASEFGAEVLNISEVNDPIEAVRNFSRGQGADAVLITVSSKSNQPIEQAAKMSRKRGRIILVGVTGLELSRTDFYEKELTFQVSCSYGPGRYDPSYEEKGNDYPIGFVRWTEQRNFEAVLDMMSEKKLNVNPLISHKFSIDEAEHAYDLIFSSDPSLGVLLEYKNQNFSKEEKIVSFPAKKKIDAGNLGVSFIGSGNYASKLLIPAFSATGVNLVSLASKNGVSGTFNGKRFGFRETTTDVEALLNDKRSNVVVIASRHDSHARYAKMALDAGKHVFVEKPLCLTHEELLELEESNESLKKGGIVPLLMVGFNRRFAPQVLKIKQLLSSTQEPKSFILTVNAGQIPSDHWLQDRKVGGGRILGEACHFIDLLRFLCGFEIKSWNRIGMTSKNEDTVSIHLEFGDGSIGCVNYFSNGSKSFPKERLDVFSSGRVLQLDNFRKLKGWGWSNFKKWNLWKQDKGQKACASTFINAIRNREPSPIPIEEIFEINRISIDLQNSGC